MERVKGEITRRFQEQGMPLDAALEKTMLRAFDCEYSIPDETSLYSKDMNIDKIKIQIQMLPDLLSLTIKLIPLKQSTLSLVLELLMT